MSSELKTNVLSLLDSFQEDKKYTVLIVEDNEENTEILVNILSTKYSVLIAGNGEEGLSLLLQNKENVSVVLLDLCMPVMDGFLFMETVSRDRSLCKIPVIVTTAHNGLDEEIRCLDLGVYDFIAKPYNPALILTRVRNVIRLQETERIIAEATMDVQTGCKNRKAYYDDIAKFQEYPEIYRKSSGLIFLDINGLKHCNDNKGHKEGDNLISEVMRLARLVFYDAEMYRIGGDEFIIISFDESRDDFQRKVAKLNSLWTDDVSASVGSVWMPETRHIERYVAEADYNMYVDKSRFYQKKKSNRRGQVLPDNESLLEQSNSATEFLPGGFFVYKADGEEELIHFNQEVVRMFGCKDSDEFKALTGNSFKGIVHPDDLSRVESGIDSQIVKQGDLDYVTYRIVRKDGSILPVRDYGRFVHTSHYGDVYYVLIVPA